MGKRILLSYLYLGLTVLILFYVTSIYSKKLEKENMISDVQELNIENNNFDYINSGSKDIMEGLEVDEFDYSNKSVGQVVNETNGTDEFVIRGIEYEEDSYSEDIKEEFENSNNSSVKSEVKSNEDNELNENENNFLSRISYNNISQPIRNSNLQLRSEPANPQVMITPFFQTTIEPDMGRRPFIGGY